MFTSNFTRSKDWPPGYRAVSIARRSPWYFRGESYLALAPTEAMLTMSIPDYVIAFDAILKQLDPQAVFAELGEQSILLCWESPGVFCHRRAVAQWLESSLGIRVPECGFESESLPVYPDMPLKGSAEARKLARTLGRNVRAVIDS